MTNRPDFPVPVTLSFDTEFGRPLVPPRKVEVEVAADLARTFARAFAFNGGDSIPLSFTSLLVGMLTGDEPTSEWLGGQFDTDLLSRIAARKPGAPFDPEALRSREGEWQSLPVL